MKPHETGAWPPPLYSIPSALLQRGLSGPRASHGSAGPLRTPFFLRQSWRPRHSLCPLAPLGPLRSPSSPLSTFVLCLQTRRSPSRRGEVAKQQQQVLAGASLRCPQTHGEAGADHPSRALPSLRDRYTHEGEQGFGLCCSSFIERGIFLRQVAPPLPGF